MKALSYLRQQVRRMRGTQHQEVMRCPTLDAKQLAFQLAKLSDAELRKHTGTLLRFYGMRQRER